MKIKQLHEFENGAVQDIAPVTIPDAVVNPDTQESLGSALERMETSIGEKVDKVEGKQLSTEDFTAALKEKLESLENYDDTEISQAVETLRSDFDTLVGGDTSSAIESFNEVVAFLAGLEDTGTLDGIIAAIQQEIAAKQDKIDDLDTIRSGAALGATAIQEHQDISHLATKEDVKEALEDKQDKVLKFENVAAASWVSDATYTDYPFRCDMACEGVTSDNYAEVVFALEQATSGMYAPLCATSEDVVSIWSASDTTVTVPTVIITI